MTEVESGIPKIRSEEIEVDRIEINRLNPRRIFPEKQIDALCKSIIEVGGIIVPLVVFEKEKDHFVLLDGERRLIAAKKLGMKTVPANIIPKALSDETNLELMFNIHMQRVQWNTAARAMSVRELRSRYPGISDDELSRKTGLNMAEIANADLILSFPKNLQKRCLVDLQPNYLIEMGKAIHAIKENLPDLYEKVGRRHIVDAFVKKIDDGRVLANTDFRFVRQIAKRLPSPQASLLIEKLIKDEDFSPRDAREIAADSMIGSHLDEFKRKSLVYIRALKKIKVSASDKTSRRLLKTVLLRVRAEIDARLKRMKTQ